MKPRALIIRTAGVNCDRELAHAFHLAGAEPELVHVNRLIQDPAPLDRADLIGFPGGFSYGDDIAAGRIFAHVLRRKLLDPLLRALDRGTPMIGICNGFQVLVKLGLLPDPPALDASDEHLQARQTATLADNEHGRFVDRWVNVQAPDATRCVWTRGLGAFTLPVAHGEGRFLAADPQAITRWDAAGQIALRYASDDNPNGSQDDIAGVCDPSGLVLGLMPHPERFVDPTQHPQWTRHGADAIDPVGLRCFTRAVEHVQSRAGATA